MGFVCNHRSQQELSVESSETQNGEQSQRIRTDRGAGQEEVGEVRRSGCRHNICMAGRRASGWQRRGLGEANKNGRETLGCGGYVERWADLMQGDKRHCSGLCEKDKYESNGV